MIYNPKIYFLLFLTYATIGWLIEVGCVYLNTNHFVNRGFLVGPYCPIFGVGALAITILLQCFYNNIFIVFIMACLMCGIIEYISSYLLEKIYHARWWDYSEKRFNLNGRICLELVLAFGLLGCLVIYVLNPLFSNIYVHMSIILLDIIFTISIIIFVTDFIVTIVLAKQVSIEAKKFKDNTLEFNTKIKELLVKRSKLHRRLINSFPKINLPKNSK